MGRTPVRAAVLALSGLFAVLLLSVAADSSPFPPPPPGQVASVFQPPPGGPAEDAEAADGAGGTGAAELYISDLAWYELFFVGIAVIFGVCLLLAPLVVLGLIRIPRWHRERAATGHRAGNPVAPPGRDLAVAVEEALDRVEHGQTREAVVACWLLLERAAAAAGSPAQAHETTTEYVARLAGEQLVSAAALTRLAGLYRVARFSGHPVDPGMRAQARSALGVLQGELPGGVGR